MFDVRKSALKNLGLALALAAGIPPLAAQDAASKSDLEQTRREVEEIRRKLDEEIRKREEERKGAAASAFNPRLTVFGDFLGRYNHGGKLRDQTGDDRFSMRETEIDLRASVDAFARGVLIVAFHEETPNTFKTNVEEGYIESTSLPASLVLKGGRFLQSFGAWNRLHTHDMPAPTRPLVIRKFFGDEGLAANGVSLSGRVPNPWDQGLEWTAEVANSDNATAFAGSSSKDPSYLGRLKWNGDLTGSTHATLGSTYLFGLLNPDARNLSQEVYGFDATWHWKPKKEGVHRSLLLQGEAYWGERDVEGLGTTGAGVMFPIKRTVRPFGAYALAQYQVDRQWYVGLRGDVSEAIANARDREKSATGYVTFYASEYLRFRLALEHLDRNERRKDLQRLMLQVTWVFGAPPAHTHCSWDCAR